jgi:hypothetical protein
MGMLAWTVCYMCACGCGCHVVCLYWIMLQPQANCVTSTSVQPIACTTPPYILEACCKAYWTGLYYMPLLRPASHIAAQRTVLHNLCSCHVHDGATLQGIVSEAPTQ